MRRWAVVLSAVTISLGAATTVAGTAVADPPDNDPYTLSGGHANGMGGVVYARGDANNNNAGHGKPGGGSTPNLIPHGGPVQGLTTKVFPIFWGRSFAAGQSNATRPAQISAFYSGVGGSNYFGTNSEYYNGSTFVNTSVQLTGSVVDSSAAPSRAPSTGTILAEVAKMVPTPVAGGYYPVYIDNFRGGAGYCAWHSSGTAANGRSYVFAFFFNLDGDSGCDPQDSVTGHPEWLAAWGNVSGHELSEMVTDPQLNAWYDSSGNENADKCAWTFNGPETLSDQTSWLIQGNWSNAAYNNNQSGYTRGGCINGN